MSVQPVRGNHIAICFLDHMGKGGKHLFKVDCHVTRPDGSRFFCGWAIVCYHCFEKANGDLNRCITTDALWEGDGKINLIKVEEV